VCVWRYLTRLNLSDWPLTLTLTWTRIRNKKKHKRACKIATPVFNHNDVTSQLIFFPFLFHFYFFPLSNSFICLLQILSPSLPSSPPSLPPLSLYVSFCFGECNYSITSLRDAKPFLAFLDNARRGLFAILSFLLAFREALKFPGTYSWAS